MFRRPISATSSLQGRQLWRIGDWGGASEQIGRRWESLGVGELQAVLRQPRPGPGGETYAPSAAVVISADPELARVVHRGGKPHADAMLVGVANGQPVLEAVDFKWTLETAEPRQVSSAVLEALLDQPPLPLVQQVERALAEAGAPAGARPLFHDGIFLAPDYPPNRARLAPRGPLPLEMVVLRPVDAIGFFSPLRGWEVGQALAAAERAVLHGLEVMERYYRLGAGVLGALRRLRSGIFAEQLAELDGVAELAELRARQRLRTTGQVIAYLDRGLRAQAELAERLKQIERSVYPFAAFRREAARRGLALDDDRRLGRLHGEVMKAVRAEMRRTGRQLVDEGQTEQQALSSLQGMAPRFTRLAQREAERRLAESRESRVQSRE